MEVCIAEIQRSDPFPFLKRQSYGLRGFHFESVCVQEKIEFAQIQNWSPFSIGLYNQKKAVVKSQR